MATVEHRANHLGEAGEPSLEAARARLEALYREHGRRVYAICASVLRDRHEAEDAAQQVFVSAFRALLHGTEPRDPGAWIATIARNESRGRGRRPASVPVDGELCDETQDDPATLVVRRSELARVWRAVEALPAAQRDALLLREVRGLDYEELADGLHVSQASVRSLLNRARRTLRARFERVGALLGPQWINLLARLVGDGPSPVFSSASRTAAVGLGAVALTGGALVAPELTPHAHHSAPSAVAASPAPTPRARIERPAAAPHVAAAPVPVSRPSTAPVQRQEDRRPVREDHRQADGGSASDGTGGDGGSSAASATSVTSGSDGRSSDGGSLSTSDGGSTSAPVTSGSDGRSSDGGSLSTSDGGSPSAPVISGFDGGSGDGGSFSTSDGGSPDGGS